ncbi:PilZ domain-containing protein [Hahella sp. CCB-MM4]|uniref:PilZ domain-containing protein n=1 Tax=Hahella sp. (strain CCB-MM4) TaxID=1926491 RepID=UPI001FEEC60A|nr:PilZ domain-containing protein [Hahella sp. CCB-MM4]
MRLTTMRDYAEKRDFIRMKVDSEITLKDSSSGESFKGICRDLSGTGMSIEVGQPFEAGYELNTSLPSNNEAFPSFDTTVKVLRCSELENERYQLGVEIIKVES